MQADVETLSHLVRHAGERGRANEAALVALLEAFVPRRLDVGTGLLIDSADRYSKQMDIVVTERGDEPAVLAQTTHLLHPMESVLACIEVKTKLSGDEIGDCLAKKRSLLALQPERDQPDGSTHPLFFVLAYSTTLMPGTIAKRLADATPSERPDCVCVLRPGVFGGTRTLIGGDPGGDGFGLGLVPLHGTDPSATDDFEQAKQKTALTEERSGRHYPLVEHDGVTYLGDSGRALLLFIEALARGVALKQARQQPTMSYYLNPASRTVLWL